MASPVKTRLLHADDVRQAMRTAIGILGTQSAFARAVDVSPQCISEILKGKRKPPPSVLAYLKLRKILMYRECDQ